MNMNASEYKKYHELFMQDNHGTNPIHTCMHIMFTVQGTLFCCLTTRGTKNTLLDYFYQYLVIILPMILANTVLAGYIYTMNLVMLTLLLFKCAFYKSEVNIKEALSGKNTFQNRRISSLTCMRGLTYLITVFSILAVDFKDFPRYLAKTERFGYSLMDTGVGLFVVMSGLVHKELRNRNLLSVFKDNYKLFSLLVLLGAARCIAVKELDYHEHVTEYGVHWNFFFTLALCKLLSSIILMFISNNILQTSIVMVCMHQFCLSNGLQVWVFSDIPRDNIINANREGIVSCMGYIAIYLYAVHLKAILNNELISRKYVFRKLFLHSLCLWILTAILNVYLPTSRVLANMGYGIYVSAISVTVLIIFLLFELVYHINFVVPSILLAINSNGFTYFLIANIFTGLINKGIRTLLLPSVQTFFIINMYMTASVIQVIYFNENEIYL